jgi:hypothetical protein
VLHTFTIAATIKIGCFLLKAGDQGVRSYLFWILDFGFWIVFVNSNLKTGKMLIFQIRAEYLKVRS